MLLKTTLVFVRHYDVIYDYFKTFSLHDQKEDSK